MSLTNNCRPPFIAPSTVLVVEDDAMMREGVAMLLRRRGFRVVVACDGRAGLSAAKHARPDIALTDIIMPELDGIGFIMALRRAHPAIKIIAMSGGGRMGNSDYLSIAAKLGADATLAKPFSGDDLAAVLSDVRRGTQPAISAVVT
jgi:DNA-binding response OmpR family regulator